jgi:hypothetical protein
MDYSAIKMKLSVVRTTLSQLIDQLDELFEEAWDANNLIKTWQTDYPNKNPLPVIEVASSAAEVSQPPVSAPGQIKIPKKFKKKTETPSIN